MIKLMFDGLSALLLIIVVSFFMTNDVYAQSCKTSNDCDPQSSKPICNFSTNKCGPCKQDGDCTNKDSLYCDNGKCVECTEKDGCDPHSSKPICNFSTNKCGPCKKDSDCTNKDWPYCDNGKCVVCKNSLNCYKYYGNFGFFCKDNECQPCPKGSVMDPATAVCVPKPKKISCPTGWHWSSSKHRCVTKHHTWHPHKPSDHHSHFGSIRDDGYRHSI